MTQETAIWILQLGYTNWGGHVGGQVSSGIARFSHSSKVLCFSHSTKAQYGTTVPPLKFLLNIFCLIFSPQI